MYDGAVGDRDERLPVRQVAAPPAVGYSRGTHTFAVLSLDLSCFLIFRLPFGVTTPPSASRFPSAVGIRDGADQEVWIQ